ncbi:MAG: hypothetical protein IIA00_00770 [Proteobacteria bacterium]|nr:hypothetical protein [Pseudomonadota bacterium]
MNAGKAVDAEFVKCGRYEFEITSERFPARAHLWPPYDPRRWRVRM